MKNDLTEEQLRQEVTVCLPLSAVLRLGAEPQSMRLDSLPFRAAFHEDLGLKIGEAYQDGIYAGLSLHEGKVVELVLLPEEFKGGWQEAVDWAAAYAKRDAHSEKADLPSRIDALVLYENLKGEFKEQAYWTGEQHAEFSDYAWVQYFSDGIQSYGGKGFKYRARAVRRLPI